MDDRYGSDVLARDPHSSRRVRSAELPIELGMVVEDAQSGYVAAAWRRIRSRVRDWTDLDAALIGRVEELIDFVIQS